MADSFVTRLKRGWNAFLNRAPTAYQYTYEYGTGLRPDRMRFSRGNEKSIVTAVFNRIAIDVAAIDIRHVRLDANDRYLEEIDSDMNNCFKLEANIDQTGRAFFQDVVLSMFDEGCIAICPIDTDDDPNWSNDKTRGSFDIQTMRVGRIVEWFPQKVKVRVYNELNGKKEEVVYSKTAVAIIENPLYAVMNEPNSTLQRLVRKLNLLDVIDEKNSSGKLDMIIQLPYIIKTEARRKQAEERRNDIEKQLSSTKYGIAYTDGTEKIVQLNRPVENNLMSQIEFLTSMLYSQLGISAGILDGTASEQEILNYTSRSIEPVISAIVDEMKRKFLTKTARSQHHSIEYFKDPFNLVPVTQIAEIADKMTRNEIMTSNEVRQIIGMKPSDDPAADELRNKNLNQSNEEVAEETIDDELEADVEETAIDNGVDVEQAEDELLSLLHQ